MFDISFWELAMIGVVALIVVGPERLPGLARTAGRWLGRARRVMAEVRTEIDRELQLEELKQSLRQQADLNSLKDVTQPIQALRDDIQAQFNDLDPGPPPGWHPGMSTAPPPDDYPEPAASNLPPPAPIPVLLQKADADAAASIDPPPAIAQQPAPQSLQTSPTLAKDHNP